MSPDNSPSKTMAASSSSGTEASYYSSASHIESREPHSTILHIENREPNNTMSYNDNRQPHSTLIESRESHHNSNITVIVSRSEERFSNSQTAANTSPVYNNDNVRQSAVNQSKGTVIEITPNSHNQGGNIPSEARVNSVAQNNTDTSISTRSSGYTESIISSTTTGTRGVSDASYGTDVSVISGGNVQVVVSDTRLTSGRVMDRVADVTKDAAYDVEQSVSIKSALPRYDLFSMGCYSQ